MLQQEYVVRAKVALAENYRANDSDGSMTAASAAYILKRTIGSFEDVGFFKFKDLLQALQQEGFLETGANSKQAFSFVLKAPIRTTSSPTYQAQRRLCADVWYAFVKEDPLGKRFLNSKTGQVRTQCENSPGHEWIEIVPVDPAKEKGLALDFLKRNEISSIEAQDSLDDPKWYVAFAEFLSQNSAQLVNAWKRERSKAVVAIVEEWRREHRVDEAIVYEPTLPRVPSYPPQRHSSTVTGNGRDALRQSLLNAIAKMSTDELLARKHCQRVPSKTRIPPYSDWISRRPHRQQ